MEYQNRVKRVRGVNFLRKFWKKFKNENFGLNLLKRSNFDAFSGLAPSKQKIISNKFNGSIYAYRVSNILIFKRIEGGGMESREG